MCGTPRPWISGCCMEDRGGGSGPPVGIKVPNSVRVDCGRIWATKAMVEYIKKISDNHAGHFKYDYVEGMLCAAPVNLVPRPVGMTPEIMLRGKNRFDMFCKMMTLYAREMPGAKEVADVTFIPTGLVELIGVLCQFDIWRGLMILPVISYSDVSGIVHTLFTEGMALMNYFRVNYFSVFSNLVALRGLIEIGLVADYWVTEPCGLGPMIRDSADGSSIVYVNVSVVDEDHPVMEGVFETNHGGVKGYAIGPKVPVSSFFAISKMIEQEAPKVTPILLTNCEKAVVQEQKKVVEVDGHTMVREVAGSDDFDDPKGVDGVVEVPPASISTYSPPENTRYLRDDPFVGQPKKLEGVFRAVQKEINDELGQSANNRDFVGEIGSEHRTKLAQLYSEWSGHPEYPKALAIAFGWHLPRIPDLLEDAGYDMSMWDQVPKKVRYKFYIQAYGLSFNRLVGIANRMMRQYGYNIVPHTIGTYNAAIGQQHRSKCRELYEMLEGSRSCVRKATIYGVLNKLGKVYGPHIAMLVHAFDVRCDSSGENYFVIKRSINLDKKAIHCEGYIDMVYPLVGCLGDELSSVVRVYLMLAEIYSVERVSPYKVQLSSRESMVNADVRQYYLSDRFKALRFGSDFVF